MKSSYKTFCASCVTIFLLLSWVCSGNASAASLDNFARLEGTISIAGGTAHIPVMNDAARAITTAHPKIRITVEGDGSGIGVPKVGEGLSDIGNARRPPSEAGIAKYGLKSYPFALGVVVVQAEGSAVDAVLAADIVVTDILNALDLLRHPLRLTATLRS